MIENNGLGLPFVGDVIKSWESSIKATIITSSIENFKVVEKERQITFKGILQGNRKNLTTKSTGERAWGSFVLHTTTDLKLNLNDIVIIKNIKYRIKGTSRKDTYYGYYRYELLEDYKG